MEMIQPLVEVLKAVWSPIARYTGYVVNPQKSFKELSKRVQDLCARKEDCQNHIKLAKRQQAPTNEYLGWLASVEQIAEEVNKIEETHPYEKRCFRGWFPDVIARVKHGDYVAEMMVQVKELQEKSKFESGFLVDLPPHQVEERPAFALKEETSAHRTLRKILAYIRDEGIKKIGIWGMGGIGKTTLMAMFNNMEEIKEMFEIVIWVTVSKSWSTSSLQDIIANRLSLDVREKSSGTRKSDDEVISMLFQELKSKKFLLLLDDVWNWVDLSKLGIPITNQDRSYTIVLTTRELSVCREMETDVDVKVETLAEGEAWEIFHSRVGDIDTSSTIYAIAKDIVRECQGLPLALNVVGGVLRRVRDVRVWRNILKKLRSPEISYADHPSDRVFDSLKVSYDALNTANLKNSFLYCGLYPEDHQITKSELIEYWRAEGLLPSPSRRTLEEARDEGHQQLHGLIDASLLEECKDDDKHIKMHDVVRDLVLKMTSSGSESRHIVRAGLLSEEETLVEDKEWEEATRISFMFNQCTLHLPEMPNCPKLSSLLFRSNVSQLEVIPKAFFNQMPNLRVLDLSYTLISSLPCSISNLVSLRTLLLQGCYRLKALPHEVNLLRRLEVLCLLRSVMKVVPGAIWELSSLKCLQFSYVSPETSWSIDNYYYSSPSGSPQLLKVIFPRSSEKIFQLGELEEVSVLGGEVDEKSHQSLEVIAKELARLPRLSSLEFNFVTVNNLSHFLQERSMER